MNQKKKKKKKPRLFGNLLLL